MTIDKQRLLIVGQPVEAFSNKMFPKTVQVPAMNRGYYLSLLTATTLVGAEQRMAIRQATLPWPTGMRNDSLRTILQEN